MTENDRNVLVKTIQPARALQMVAEPDTGDVPGIGHPPPVAPLPPANVPPNEPHEKPGANSTLGPSHAWDRLMVTTQVQLPALRDFLNSETRNMNDAVGRKLEIYDESEANYLDNTYGL
jgi:hypothetical protein